MTHKNTGEGETDMAYADTDTENTQGSDRDGGVNQSSAVTRLCQLIRKRSSDNQRAAAVLQEARLPRPSHWHSSPGTGLDD